MAEVILKEGLRKMQNKKTHILFLCTGNAARSQIAEGLARHYGDDDRIEVSSAGFMPIGVVHKAKQVMKEIGIDISSQHSKKLNNEMIDRADYVITLCNYADELCPSLPSNIRRLHWPMPDPVSSIGNQEEVLNCFRHVRDTLKEKILTFFKERGLTS